MSNQSGFDYELMVERLHRGACAFQNLRAHRRQRGQAPAAPPVAAAREPVAKSPPHPGHTEETSESRPAAMLEPQAFMTVGNRVVPVFGDMSAVLGATAAPQPPAPAVVSDPPSPRPAPSPESPSPLPAASAPTVPASTASSLKLPVPTPPPRLGLVHSRPPAPRPASAATPEPSAATPAPNAAETQAEAPSAGAQETTLAAFLDARAHQEALRIEQIHADHRVAISTLLKEHREELRTRSEADAARTTQLLREVLAEHRSELARATEAHAEQLTQILTQLQTTTQREVAAESELRSAVIEQANLQREMNADTADNINALTTVVADLGQSVGMLAVAAAQDGKQGRLPTRPIFAPPLPVEPAAIKAVPSASIVPTAPAASPDNGPTAAPASSPASNVPTAANSPAPPTPRSDVPATPLRDSLVLELPQRRSIPLTHAEEAAARQRLSKSLDEDREDGDLDDIDDDDPPRRRPLRPITDIEPGTAEAEDD